MTYRGYFRFSRGQWILVLLGVLLFSIPGILAFFPKAHEAFWRDADGGAIILQVPRPLIALLSGGVVAAGIANLVVAAWGKRPVVVMNSEGVTCGHLLNRHKHVPWGDIARVVFIDYRWGEIRFMGGPSGRRVVGRFPPTGQDLRGIWVVIGHYRPDLVRSPD